MKMTVEMIAEVCHEANRVLQHHLGEQVSRPWETAGDEQQESAIDGVRNALVGASAELSHENWLEFKRSQGWVYGEVKDEERKTHPCMVPYRALPEEQKFKDKLFLAIVGAFKHPI